MFITNNRKTIPFRLRTQIVNLFRLIGLKQKWLKSNCTAELDPDIELFEGCFGERSYMQVGLVPTKRRLT